MTQAQWMLIVLKIGLVASPISAVLFVGLYSWWAKWWKNPVGQSLVAEIVAWALALVPLAFSAFLSLDRFDSEIASWVLVVCILAGPVILLWRTWIFWRIHRSRRAVASSGGGTTHEAVGS